MYLIDPEENKKPKKGTDKADSELEKKLDGTDVEDIQDDELTQEKEKLTDTAKKKVSGYLSGIKNKGKAVLEGSKKTIDDKLSGDKAKANKEAIRNKLKEGKGYIQEKIFKGDKNETMGETLKDDFAKKKEMVAKEFKNAKRYQKDVLDPIKNETDKWNGIKTELEKTIEPGCKMKDKFAYVKKAHKKLVKVNNDKLPIKKELEVKLDFYKQKGDFKDMEMTIEKVGSLVEEYEILYDEKKKLGPKVNMDNIKKYGKYAGGAAIGGYVAKEIFKRIFK